MTNGGGISVPEGDEVVLECIELTKRFGGLTAVDRVSMDLRKGEVLALVGDNGAGKSTLVQIISGVLHPDGGSILLEGRPVTHASPMDARRMGIETIYQDLALCENLDAASNIFLGQEIRRRVFGVLPSLDRASMRAESRRVLEQLDIVDPGPHSSDPPALRGATPGRRDLAGRLLERPSDDHGRADSGPRRARAAPSVRTRPNTPRSRGAGPRHQSQHPGRDAHLGPHRGDAPGLEGR